MLDASRLADADEPVAQQGGRRARMLGAGGEGESKGGDAGGGSGGAAAGGAASSGSTLFERMANLSRQAPETSDDDDDDDDDEDSGGSMRIPRFLGRQNNQ